MRPLKKNCAKCSAKGEMTLETMDFLFRARRETCAPFPDNPFGQATQTWSKKTSLPRHSKLDRTLDWIGDIHGNAEKLRGLLLSLGYSENRGFFSRPGTLAVFLGDMLNRGPQILETTRIVRSMCDNGAAIFLLGNHELYALRDAAATKQNIPVRHFVSEKHGRYLLSSKQAFAGREGEWQDLLEWLFRRPIAFDAGGTRGVHACWHPSALARFPSQTLRFPDLIDRRSLRFHAIQILLEGPSTVHPSTPKSFRVRWWTRSVQTWKNFAYSHRGDLPGTRVPALRLSATVPYTTAEPPLFFGHYGFSKPASPIAPNIACLDYAVASDGPLGAYRWQGECRLAADQFFSFPPLPSSPRQ